MKLTGNQFQSFCNALINAFPSKFKFEQLLKYQFNKNIENIVIGTNLEEIVFKLISTAEAEGWIVDLLIGSRELNPNNPELYKLAQEFGISSNGVCKAELEKLLVESNSFLDITQWRNKIEEIEAQVCRLEIKIGNGFIYGTGFLVGPDLLLTNYHVVECLIKIKDKSPSHFSIDSDTNIFIARFDYKTLADGSIHSQGAVCGLHCDNWLIDFSTNSLNCDLQNIDGLDYALLKLDHPIGSEIVGKNPDLTERKRGWISLPNSKYDFEINSPLFIVQHPKAEPLKIAIDSNAIINVNKNHTTVKYRTNTLPGSSGSPCFNQNWELIAIHHSGDPDFSSPSYNAGTPIFTILCQFKMKNIKLY